MRHSSSAKHTLRREIKTLVLLFGSVFVGILVVTNFNLFASNFSAFFSSEPESIAPITSSLVSQNGNIASIVDTAEKNDKAIQGLLKNYQVHADATTITPSSEEVLQSHLDNYNFSFNTVPPVNRLVVPDISLDVPIISMENMPAVDFAKGRFDKELYQGIVKYPTTPAPGQEGNTLLFGHTSYEVWKSNPYGTIFKDIPKLKDGVLIQVLREGNLYEYKVVDIFIVQPKQVNAQYMTYQNAGGSYITLMGCYPLGTDKKRIMVVAKLIKK